MFSMPVEGYWMEDKVSETLQTIYRRLVQDFNELATNGITTDQGALRCSMQKTFLCSDQSNHI